jgi:hypothetical protein
MLGEIYFRLDNDLINHTRQCFSFMNFVGDVGGVRDVLIAIISFFFGGFANF